MKVYRNSYPIHSWFLLAALGSCASSSPNADESPASPESSAKPTAIVVADASSGKKNGSKKTSGLTFEIGLIETNKLGVGDIRCLRLSTKGKKCFSLSELKDALPADIASRTQKNPTLLVELIDSLYWVNGLRGFDAATDRSKSDKLISLWVDSARVLQRDQWRSTRSVLAPDTKGLKAPSWHGNTLTWIGLSKKLDWKTKQTTITATPHEVDFNGKLAVKTGAPIVSQPVNLKAERDSVNRFFGGEVGGFFSVAISKSQRLMVAMDPDKGSAGFVFTTVGSANRKLASWNEVAPLLPKGSEPQVLANLLDGLSLFLGGTSFITIKDAAAYKQEYKEENWDTLRLSYWVDEMRVSKFTIPDFDTIADPNVRAGKLVLFFLPTSRYAGGGRKPHRLEIDLHQLGQNLVLQGTAMATSVVVSDTRGSGGPVKH